MKVFTLCVVILVASSGLAAAGEIYGSITEAGKPVAEGLKVQLVCGADKVVTATDKYGAYRVFAQEEGECTLTLTIGAETPSIAVESFEDSARYNLVLEKKDGKYALRSE